jgi:hypothetical protein
MPIKCPVRPRRGPTRDERAREQARRERLRREYEQQERMRQEQARRAWERARQSAASRQSISAADQVIALELVNAGYRLLSRKHHPDLGGSHEQMVAINKVCDVLRNMITGKK